MKLSIFTTLSDPLRRGDNYKDALSCYSDLADELVIVDGSTHVEKLEWLNGKAAVKIVPYEWPQEFGFEFIGQQMQRGFEACSGDWAIRMDMDFIFHERDFGKIRQAMKDFPASPALSFYKWQFILPDRYNLKSRLLLAFNNNFKDNIKIDSGGDLCQPSFNGGELPLSDMPQAEVPIYNYDKMTKTFPQIFDDTARMARAWSRKFGDYHLGENAEEAFNEWMMMTKGRFAKPSQHISLSEHPKYVQQTIKNLSKEQFGYDGFGQLERNDYVSSTGSK